MEQYATAALSLVGVVLGIVLRGEYARLTERGRLHHRISVELDMLTKLPDGSTRDALREHVEGQVRYLVAHETPDSLHDRLTLRWDVAGLSLAVLLGALVAIGEFGRSGPVAWMAGIVAAGLTIHQLGRVMSVWSGRKMRRWRRLRDAQNTGPLADPDRRTPEAG